MRVLLASIYDVSRSGGLSSHVAELSAALGERGLHVRVVTPYGPESRTLRRALADAPRVLLRKLDQDRAFLHFLRWNRWFLRRAIEGYHSRDGADAVHAHDPIAALAASDAIARAGARARAESPRLVLTVHGDIANMAVSDGVIHESGRARRAVEKFEETAYRRADVLVTVDGRLRDHCLALGGERRIEVIRNFTDTGRFRPVRPGDRADIEAERRRLGLGEDCDVLLVARRLVKKNGVIHAVRAMPALLQRGSRSGRRTVMLIAGRSGPEHDGIAAEAARIGPREAPAVRLLGDVDHGRLATLYRLAAVALVPSVPDAGVVEATSITAIEAMSSGCPVVASRIGGLAEIIEDGRTGILVPPADPAAIADAAFSVLNDAALAARLGAEARAHVEREHATGPCAARVSALYVRPAGDAAARGERDGLR